MVKELQQNQLFKFKMIRISKIFSTLFFLGYVRWAPGTVGSIASLIIIIFLSNLISNIQLIALFIVLSILAIKLINIYSKSINKNDAREIIIDEFLGIYLIIIFSQNFNSFNEILKIFLILILFRFFDIVKPFPANWIDKNMKSSYGILLDDIIAGIYTIIVLFLINVFI